MVAVLVQLGAGGVALAQTASADGSTASADNHLNDIVVTAQKKRESALDVPMSLAALSGDQLAKQQSLRLEDFAGQIAGLNLIGSGTTSTQLIIRGVTTGSSAINSAVATYIDETPYVTTGQFGGSSYSVPDLDTFDMNRIEVLRGPQGTLYGANALGGLLKYVSAAPDPTHFATSEEAGLRSTTDGGVGYDVHAMVNVPITDELAIRVVGFHNFYPGFIDDPSRGLTQLNKSHFDGGRASLLYQPSSSFSIRLTGIYQRKDGDDLPYVDLNSNLTPVAGKLDATYLVGNPYHTTNQIYNATINGDLGFAKVISSTSYTKMDTLSLEDQTKDLGPVITEVAGENLGELTYLTHAFHSITQEVRLTSPNADAPLTWLVGGYFTHRSTTDFNGYYPIDPATHQVLYDFQPAIGTFSLPTTFAEVAGFANADYHITSNLDIAGGVRYSHNAQSFTEVGTGLFGAGLNYSYDAKANVFTYSSDIRWHVTPQLMLYGRVADGYEPGGISDIVPSVPLARTYQSSTATNYEVGAKGSFLNRHLTAEVSAFDIEWRNIQLSAQIDGFNTITNGGGARSRGFEWKFSYLPLAGLTLDFNGAYTDAHVTEALPASVNGPAGSPLPGVPKLSTSVAANYQWRLHEGLAAFAGANWRYTSGRYADFETPGARPEMPGYSLVDLRVGIQTDHYNLSAYVKNVSNKIAVTYYYAETENGPSGQQAGDVTTPRTIGVSLTTNF